MQTETAKRHHLRQSGSKSLSIALAVLALAIHTEAGAAEGHGPLVAANGQKGAAKEYYARAVALYRAGNRIESLAEFQRAYEITPHYAVLFNIGQIRSELGEPVEAIKALRQYLEEGAGRVDAARKAAAQRVLVHNEQLVGFLQIQIEPQKATVLVDGKPWVQSETPQPVALGSHAIVAQCDGHVPQAVTVQITPNSRQSQHLSLPQDPQTLPQPAWLNTTCRIAETKVQLDDQAPIDMSSRNETLRVTSGKHRLRFTRGGYLSQDFDLDVSPGQIATVDCGLERLTHIPLEYRARLSVETADPGARVLVDDRPFSTGPIPAGRHHIKVLHDQNLAWEREIALRPGQDSSLVVDPPRYLQVARQEQAVQRAKVQRRWAYITGGTGIILASGAVAALALSSHRYDEWASERNNRSMELSQSANKAVGIQRIEDLGIGLGVGGLICFATSAYLWFSSSSSDTVGRVTSRQQANNSLGTVSTVW